MNSPGVHQLGVLAELFAQTLAIRSPASVAILGIAGGNGLDRINSENTKRVLGLDVNPQYLEVVRRRYASLHGLELHCIDLANEIVNIKPVDLVHAALVFEHAGVDRCLDNAVSLVAKKGSLSIVLQLPSVSTPEVSTTAFPAMQSLKSHFSLIDPGWLCESLQTRKFELTFETQRSLPAGKAFWMGIFSQTLAD